MSDICDTEFEMAHLAPIHLCLKHEVQWSNEYDYDLCIQRLNELVELAKNTQVQGASVEDNVNHLLDAFYTQWAFSGTGNDIAPSKLNSIAYALSFHTGNPIPMAIIISYLFQQLDLSADVIFFEGEVAVQIEASRVEGFIIEPCSGQQRWYIQPENDPENELHSAFQLIDGEDLLKMFLGHQKWAFIGEKKYFAAFKCVEQLMALIGDDPYERRDRGYLLQQLNCDEMAKSDLEFFITECPDDPSIELVQHQLEELESSHNTLH